MRRFALVLALPLLFAAALPARAQSNTFVKQSWSISSCNGHYGNTRSYSLFGSHRQFCELRRITLPANGEVNVRDHNGGIQVIGRQRNTIELEARVMVQSGSQAQAEATAHKVTIHTKGVIHADGPSAGFRGAPSWYVNYRLYVPENIAARLHTENGGLELRHLDGTVSGDASNGGLTLDDVNGNVKVSTINGGITARLQGEGWRGGGLDAETTNGGIHVTLSRNYSAHLKAQTVNGGVSVNLPAHNQRSHGHAFEGDLGHGGPTIHFESVNGGITVGSE